MTKDLHELGDQLDDAIAEILTLWPRLAGALERDAGLSEGERVATSTNVHTLPVNLDVMSAVRTLHDEAWLAVHRARALLGESAANRPIPDLVDSLGVLYRRLVGRGLNGEARRLAGTVFRWHRTIRAALGLSRPPLPVQGASGAVHCPLHDDPLVQLRQRGDEGRFDETANGDREAIRWQHGGGLYCPSPDCDGEWGPSEYPFLGRLVAEQRRRLARISA
ncbi:hypothetical protein NE235_10635 [Actinoallomurus spadix]|uniref:DUF222 domain-containing protein n=1 Tax=Actinoallomurus spadix TaxID=79912 RepID=A0ABN0WVD9_9ACTN|nr:hypothetical protein [Actinoallomurus spadix]MCO5986558.1 hypothetical protein [Actinoallomurus spadix]